MTLARTGATGTSVDGGAAAGFAGPFAVPGDGGRTSGGGAISTAGSGGATRDAGAAAGVAGALTGGVGAGVGSGEGGDGAAATGAVVEVFCDGVTIIVAGRRKAMIARMTTPATRARSKPPTTANWFRFRTTVVPVCARALAGVGAGTAGATCVGEFAGAGVHVATVGASASGIGAATVSGVGAAIVRPSGFAEPEP